MTSRSRSRTPPNRHNHKLVCTEYYKEVYQECKGCDSKGDCWVAMDKTTYYCKQCWKDFLRLNMMTELFENFGLASKKDDAK
jgi:hypothetical protein